MVDMSLLTTETHQLIFTLDLSLILSSLRRAEKIADMSMSIAIYRDSKRCLFEIEIIFWIRSNPGKLNFYLLWHRLESVMWNFFPSSVGKKMNIILKNSLTLLKVFCSFLFGKSNKMLWHGALTLRLKNVCLKYHDTNEFW